MNLEEYSKKAMTTLTDDYDYGDINPQLMGQILGLVGESGEVADKFKKIIRDKAGKLSDEDRREMAKELGDVLWYINSIAVLIGLNLEDVANNNLEKLASRKLRNKISGSGDNR